MAMNWLKGLVAPAAQYGAQQIAQHGQQPGGPPVGGMSSPYGVPPPQDQPMPFGLQQPGGVPQGTGVPGAMEWSVGTKTQGSSSGGISGGGISGTGGQSLEARCAQLQHDVDSLALFARTLLTMLEAKNVVTRAEFEETKKQLDLLDGKLDDR